MDRNDEIDLGQLALTLWRGKFIIGGLAALGFVIGVWYGFLHAVPVYTAKGLCCTNPVRDSSRESSVVAGMHEQTHIPDLQDQKLASLQ